MNSVVSPYDSIQLPAFPASLDPLASDLHALAREHSQNSDQKIPVVGIAGCPGVGKTTITNLLAKKLRSEGISCVVIRFDDWTNPKEARQNGYFNLQGVHDFFQAFLKRQARIEKPVDDEFSDRQWREVVDLTQVDLILFEGLFALSRQEPALNYSQYCDKGIFVDASETDITDWKMKRPGAPERTEEEWKEHMAQVFACYHASIEPFKSDAAWIVSKDAHHGYNLSKSH